MSFYVVTVTYGNRFGFLKQVINSLLEQEINKIVIVSNGSENETLTNLNELGNTYPNLIEIINLEKNTGSANGFSIGIEYAFNSGAEFVWLLDDDNMPQMDALNILKDEWRLLIKKFDPNKLALLSYREDRKIYLDAIRFEKPALMLGRSNSFLGFHIVEKIKSLFKNDYNSEGVEKERGVVAVAPYGGLFFNRSLISLIGLPDKSYFLYGDDFDYSYRITKEGGKIFLIRRSQIVDLETSFHLVKKKSKWFKSRFLNTDSKTSIFYSVRNGIRFEKKFISNRCMYLFNASIYVFLTFLILVIHFKHLWKFKYIMNGIKEGLFVKC